MDQTTTQSIAVIGFGRSGTSLTMRLLNLLGVAIGSSDDLLQPHESDNPRGYFEPRWMVDLNDEILAALGSSWWQPLPAADGWERDETVRPLRERAAQLIEEKFGDAPVRGWKDPRVTLTLPLWQQVVPDQRYVICVRNPIDAIASIQRRPDPTQSVTEWGAMWLEYTARALRETAGRPRIVVFYEDYFRDGEAEVARLARFLGLDPGDERCARAAATIESGLRHHVTTPLELASLDAIPAAARLLYLALRATQEERRAADAPDADGLAAAVERLGADLLDTGQAAAASGALADLHRQVAAVEAHARGLEQRLTLAEQLAEERGRALEEVRALAGLREREGARLQSELDGQAAAAAAASRALADLRGSASWRLTAPARRAKRLFARRGR